MGDSISLAELGFIPGSVILRNHYGLTEWILEPNKYRPRALAIGFNMGKRSAYAILLASVQPWPHDPMADSRLKAEKMGSPRVGTISPVQPWSP